ncbi:phosphotransferase enzyme family protein [Neolewinella persica]|uniref:phosphotransferase enzyme family protein n=1 Tax=Neolewinella persica TaxID=70998 RepID=UPI00037516D6|nr:phosphotransferase [Neolewinella persica]
MNHLFDKHYTSEIFHELCNKHGILPENTILIKEDSNLIYDCGDSILRVSHSAIRSAGDMDVELDWLDFLNREKVPVVRIIPSLAGKKMVSVGDLNKHFTAVRFEKIKGSRISGSTWNVAHFQKLGKLTGLIHRTGQAYRFKDYFTYSHWDELIECSYTNILPIDKRGLQQLNHRLVTEFRSYPRDTENYGLIHNDIHHENYLLIGQRNKIVLFDFEVTCQSWYIYEIATALYYACLVGQKRNNLKFEQVFLRNFVKGYRKEYDLPPVDFEVVLKFMLYRDLFLYGYVAKMWQQKEVPQSTRNYLDLIDTSIAVRRGRLGM